MKFKLIKIFLLLLCVCSYLFCCYRFFLIFMENITSKTLKEELIEKINIPEDLTEDKSVQINFDELKNINQDVVGWINIKDSQINYPIVQGNNNSFYLNHSFEKKWSNYGSIFIDFNSSPQFNNYNTFIYGHHTKNGSMFGELYKFMNYDYYKEHNEIYLYTPTKNYIGIIFSAYLDSTTSDSYKKVIRTSVEYNEYLEIIKKKSNYKINVDIDTNVDKIITLYSCSHEPNKQKTDRYFIHAVLRSVED